MLTTASALGMAKAKDAAHLLVAAQQGRVFVTHNAGHYKVLHDAWLLWSREWRVAPAHAGILILPHEQPAILSRELAVFFTLGLPLTNECYSWQQRGGWIRYS